MKLNRRGLIATIVYHTLLLLLLVLAGLTYPVPPPGEEGILVNFGTDETGLGEMEPAGDDQQAGDPELPVSDPIQDQVEESTPVTETLPEEQQRAVTPPPREQQREDQTQEGQPYNRGVDDWFTVKPAGEETFGFSKVCSAFSDEPSSSRGLLRQRGLDSLDLGLDFGLLFL